jgi:hypothetical protein
MFQVHGNDPFEIGHFADTEGRHGAPVMEAEDTM